MCVRVADRPSKLTAGIQQTAVDILRNCGIRIAAAGRANTNMTTFLTWLKRGEETRSGMYHEFLAAVRDAEAHAAPANSCVSP